MQLYELIHARQQARVLAPPLSIGRLEFCRFSPYIDRLRWKWNFYFFLTQTGQYPLPQFVLDRILIGKFCSAVNELKIE